MSFDGQPLFELLPAILRMRDSAGDAPGPLRELVGLFGEQLGALEEDIRQLYDDQFIETCAPWVVPYIGDLVGCRGLDGRSGVVRSARAEVAHTIAYRRRKGTVIVLEQLGRDVTGWETKAVEFFQKLIVTQYMNHRRLQCRATPAVRDGLALEAVGGAFDPVMRTVDVRRIALGRGRYNLPNVGLFVHPVQAHPLTASPAVAVDARRWRFDPLGVDRTLFHPARDPAAFERLLQPLDVPGPLTRRAMAAAKADHVPASLSVRVIEGGVARDLGAADVRVCHLGDDGASWAHLPDDDRVAIDPTLGRLALPDGLAADTRVEVTFQYGFTADLGGGEYERSSSFAITQDTAITRVAADVAAVQAALDALEGSGGCVEIDGSGRLEGALHIRAGDGLTVELRSRNESRPTVILSQDLVCEGGVGSRIVIGGLLIAGAAVRVPLSEGNELGQLELRHCTVVPGRSLDSSGEPVSPDEPAVVVERPATQLRAVRCILGPLRAVATSTAALVDCIVDATDAARVAFAALDGAASGGALSLDACSVIGRVHALEFPLVTNAILLATPAAAPDPWSAPVRVERRQKGCVRFSFLPPASRVPRRYRCWPESATTPGDGDPQFATLRYGEPTYARLAGGTGAGLLTGADDEAQPGAFHHVHEAQRLADLRLRLDEYLQAGLSAGIILET